jgi:hypothetical protein
MILSYIKKVDNFLTLVFSEYSLILEDNKIGQKIF